MTDPLQPPEPLRIPHVERAAPPAEIERTVAVPVPVLEDVRRYLSRMAGQHRTDRFGDEARQLLAHLDVATKRPMDPRVTEPLRPKGRR